MDPDTRLILHLDHRAVVARHGLKIGSGPANDIVLDQAGVARLHALIRQTDHRLHAVAVEPEHLARDDQSPCDRLELRPGLRFFIGTCQVECAATTVPEPGPAAETPVTLAPVEPDHGLQPLYDRPVLRLGLVGLRGAGKTSLLAALATPPPPGAADRQPLVLRHEWLPNADQPRDLPPRRVRRLKEEFAAGNHAIRNAVAALARGDTPAPTGSDSPGLQRFVFQLALPQGDSALVELVDYDGALLEQLNDLCSGALQQVLRGAEAFLILPPPRAGQHWQPLLHALALLAGPADPPPVAVLAGEARDPGAEPPGLADFTAALGSLFPEVASWPPGPAPANHPADHPVKTTTTPRLQALQWLAGRALERRRQRLGQQLETLQSRIRQLAPLTAPDHVRRGLVRSFAALLSGRADRFNDPDAAALGPALEQLRADAAHDLPVVRQVDELASMLKAKTAAAERRHRGLTRTVRAVTAAAATLLLLAAADLLTNHHEIAAARRAVEPVRLETPAEPFHQALDTLRRYERSPWYRHLVLRATSLSKNEAAELRRQAGTRRRELLARQFTAALADPARQPPATAGLDQLIDEFEQHYAHAGGDDDDDLRRARQALRAGRLTLTMIEALAARQREAFESAAAALAELPEDAVLQALTWHHDRLGAAADQLARQAAEPGRFASLHGHLRHCREATGDTRALAPVRRAIDDLIEASHQRLLDSMARAISAGDPGSLREHLRALDAVPPGPIEAALDARLADIDAALVALLNDRLQASPPDFDGAGAQLAALHEAARSGPAPAVLPDMIKKGFAALDRAEADHRAYEQVRADPSTAAALEYLENPGIDRLMRPALEDWMNQQLVQVQTAIALAADEDVLAAHSRAEVVVQAGRREVARFELAGDELQDPDSRGESNVFFVNPRDPVRIEAEVTLARSRAWWFGETSETHRGERDYLWRNTPNERVAVPLHPDDGESSLSLELEVVERSRPEVPPRWGARLTSLDSD